MLVGLCAASLVLAGCTPNPPEPEDGGAQKGQLTVLSLGPVATWDPQRMSTSQDVAFASRVFLRTLTTFPAGADAAAQRTVVGDLAADTGTADATRTVWTFTLREGVKWQDGSDVTCEDVRYGVSRSFAEPFASEGLNYPTAYLAIPRKADGRSTYGGPFRDDKAGQAAFEKAVTCDGRAITFRLAVPVPDFNQVVASPVFAPVKKAQDRRADGTYAVYSTGPYRLRGAWDPSTGGTFERNPEWDRGSDPVRKAIPQSIRYVEGTESQTAVQRVLGDEPAYQQSVTLDSAPPAMQQQVLSDSGMRSRSVNPASQFVDYLAPNVAKGVMRDAKVRRALALATSRERYVTALGGASTASVAYTLIGPVLPGHRSDDPTGAGEGGDPAAAMAVLQEAKLTLPVKIRVAYRSTPTADKAMAALANGWHDAGFDVTLQPIAQEYFGEISKARRQDETDVFWANWAPARPSAATLLPPLFDSRLNLTKDGTGRDYAGFADPKVDTEITRISALQDPQEQAQAWSELDARLAERGAFVALAQRRSLYVAGTKVTGLAANEALGGFVDLAGMGVAE